MALDVGPVVLIGKRVHVSDQLPVLGLSFDVVDGELQTFLYIPCRFCISILIHLLKRPLLKCGYELLRVRQGAVEAWVSHDEVLRVRSKFNEMERSIQSFLRALGFMLTEG